jgi:hypothetical protein
VIHFGTHLAVPVLVAAAFYRPRWPQAAAILLATMLVDLDHLLADPTYDPERCSIGFHPLHSVPAIALYVVLVALPLALRLKAVIPHRATVRTLHLVGVGLLIHMALDLGDCFL